MTEEWESLDEDLQIRSLALASSSLEALVGHRVTACPVTVRPCPPGCGCATRDCFSCDPGCQLTFPFIGELLEVRIDGELQNTSNFEVQDNRFLVYQGAGSCPFTGPQNLAADLDQPGTWSVTYLPGYPVDSLGAQAVTLLALEFAKACTGRGKCALPKNVRTVSRFGMTYEVQTSMFPDGYTGIQLVDAYIDLWNPNNRGGPSIVFSPDVPEPRVVRP